MIDRPALTPAEQATFLALQAQLPEQWRLIATRSREQQSIVVVPSLSMEIDLPAATQQAYEERFLFLMLLLRLPRAHVIYVTSQPILPETIDYYLGLLPGVVPSHARARLHLIAALDGSSRPLSLKLLERPRLIERIRSAIPSPTTCHLVPFNTTALEQALAVRLGIPMYANDPRFEPLGSKTGCRRLFAEEGLSHPQGVENLHGVEELVEAIAGLRAQRPALRQVLVKLNEGVSGLGNAVVDLVGLPTPGASSEQDALAQRVRELKLEAAWRGVDEYFATFEREGGVVEERLQGDDFRSPSVQLRITPLGEVEILSTHDQLLGGPGGMSFLGAVFPADEGYAAAITAEARHLGLRLAREGVIGRCAVDFVAVRATGEPWRVYAIELNLRKGGTTAPYLTLEFLTQGRYDADLGRFVAKDGRAKFYVASDHVESPAHRRLQPLDLFDVAVQEELHWNSATQTGVVFHMLAAVSEQGFFGLTAVGDSAAQARELYDRTIAAVATEAGVTSAP